MVLLGSPGHHCARYCEASSARFAEMELGLAYHIDF